MRHIDTLVLHEMTDVDIRATAGVAGTDIGATFQGWYEQKETLMRDKLKEYLQDFKVFLLSEELFPVWLLPTLFFTGLFVGLVLSI